MRRSLLNTIKTQVLQLKSGDTLVFTIGNLEQNILPTERDLRDFRRYVKKEIHLDKDVDIAVFSPVVHLSKILRKKKSTRRKRKNK